MILLFLRILVYFFLFVKPPIFSLLILFVFHISFVEIFHIFTDRELFLFLWGGIYLSALSLSLFPLSSSSTVFASPKHFNLKSAFRVV